MTKGLLDQPKPLITPIPQWVLYFFIFLILLHAVLFTLVITGQYEHLQDNLNLAHLLINIFCIVLLYKIWAILRPENIRKKFLSAILRLLIPFYNMYWLVYGIMQLFWGWATEYNKTLTKHNLKKFRMPQILGFAASVAPFLLIVTTIFFLVESETVRRNTQYVMRDGKPVPVLHEGQVKKGEKLYQERGGLLFPAWLEPTPKEWYSSYIRKLYYARAAVIYYDLIMILFFWRASLCANFLYRKIDLDIKY